VLAAGRGAATPNVVVVSEAGDAGRPVWAAVDLDAVARNVGVLRRRAAPAAVWAVVKADGYGHGAVPVARAALSAGADGLCVALVEEAAVLRRAGIDAPILILAEPPPRQYGDAVRLGVQAVVYSEHAIDGLAAAVCGPVRLPVHLKIDTGMHRVGAPPAAAAALARRIMAIPSLELAGLMTHLAIADEPDDPFTDRQLDAFDDVLESLRAADIRPPLVHAANSAGAIAHPRSRYSFVRAGIAVYGIAPGPCISGECAELRPALSLRARVGFVKRVAAGERISYGLRHRFTTDTNVATLPIGYADGVPRRLATTGGEVLIHGRRRPIVGVVTMDQLMVDCGDDDVARGDEAVLIGTQEGEQITADEWARRLGTIAYEITCGVSGRVPRRYTGGGFAPDR
jgi:alanine racemase